MCPEAASDASAEPSQDTEPSAKPAPKSSSQVSAKSAQDANSAAEADSASASASAAKHVSAADQAQDAESSESPAESATSSAMDAAADQRKDAGTSFDSATFSASESAHNAQPASVSTAALSSDSGKQANTATEADPDSAPKSGEVADPAQAAKAANITLHPATTHLTDALDSELHSEVSRVATNQRAADAEFSAQGSVALPDLDTAKRELEHGHSAESPRSPHTFGLDDMSQYADIDLTKGLNDPNAAQLVGAETDSESEQPVESSKDDSVPQIEQPPKGDDTVPQVESPPVADLDDLHAETSEIIGSDAKYAPVLSAKDQAAKDGAKSQESSAQVGICEQNQSKVHVWQVAVSVVQQCQHIKWGLHCLMHDIWECHCVFRRLLLHTHCSSPEGTARYTSNSHAEICVMHLVMLISNIPPEICRNVFLLSPGISEFRFPLYNGRF